jgi:4-hydroxymandelate oxidase
MSNRRAFLKFVAGSPLLAGLPMWRTALAAESSLTSAGMALNVFDFEPLAKQNIPPAHWGYLASGVDSEVTLRANEQGFAHYALRPRRFIDVSHLDLSTELLGMKVASPVVLCPLGAQKAFHPEGEVAVARAAKSRSQLQILSTVASSSVEEVTEARGSPVWFQLYTTDRFEAAAKLVQRAERAGCPVVAVTVDLPAGRNLETFTRFQRTDSRPCGACHVTDAGGLPTSGLAHRPMFTGIDAQSLLTQSPALTWDFIRQLRTVTRMKILIKGLETREDALLAVKHGADGIVVSNHGGRASETGRAAIDALPEVVAAVAGRIPVLVDGGVRRGTDVLKALALGASAVGIGRPYIWGLGAFGQPGVERVLDILNNELRLAMVACGARSLKEITPAAIMNLSRPA